jgi:hypothetical protein
MSPSLEQIADIIKIVGLVTGGLWAAWTFHKLQRVRAAELENRARLTAIQRSTIEQEELRTRLLRQQPQLDIQLDVSETGPVTETCKSSLFVTVIVENQGQQNLEVDFLPSALTVARMIFDNNEIATLDIRRFGPSYFAVIGNGPPSNEPQMMTQRRLRVGQKRKMALAVLPIHAPGAYVVQFHAVYRKMPFDGEEPFRDAPVQINAIEQKFFYATGRPAEYTSVVVDALGYRPEAAIAA